MTFLELINRYKRECGVSGVDIDDVDTVSGEMLRLRDWIVSAWVDIQNLHAGQWSFLRTSSSHTMAASDSLLDINEWEAGAVNRWKIDSFRISEPGEGRGTSVPLEYLPYDQFVVSVGLDPSETNKPKWFTVRPNDKAIIVAPAADAAYSIFFDYLSEPVELEDSTDEPACPAKYHMLIVYEAMLSYGGFEAAPEVIGRAKAKRAELLFAMKMDCLPMITFGGPLA